jgi:CDP-4-dehydro-6-deoxyglucose reductase
MIRVTTSGGHPPSRPRARDALATGHTGPIALFHGSTTVDDLYYDRELRVMAREFPNLHCSPCLDGEECPPGYTRGRVDELAMPTGITLTGMRIFLCSHPAMVQAGGRRAYLAGAALSDILSDAFDFKELRRPPGDSSCEPR